MSDQDKLDLELIKIIHDSRKEPTEKEIDELLKKGANPNAKSGASNGYLIHYASLYLDSKVVELLIKYGADVNARNYKNETPLHLVTDENITSVLIKNGADVDILDNNNRTALDNAIESDSININIIKDMLSSCNVDTFKKAFYLSLGKYIKDERNSADIDMISIEIITLLISNNLFDIAFEDDKEWISEAVSNLIEFFLHHVLSSTRKIMVSIISKTGIEIFRDRFTIQFLISGFQFVNGILIRELEFLIELGADFNTIDSRSGDTILMVISDDSPKTTLEAIKYIINHVDDKASFINTANYQGERAITNTVRYMNSDVVKFLIENGADINVKDDEGETLLMQASRNNTDISISYLIKNGADIDAQSNDGDTALSLAIEYNQADIVKTLLDNNAHIFLENNQGKNALDEAIKIKNNPILTLLCNYIIKNNIDLDLDLDKYGVIINKYISSDILELRNTGTNIIVNSLNNTQDDLLIKNLTSDNPNIDTVKNLLENGANANIKIINAFNTIIKLTKTQQGINIIILLLEYKLNANLKNRYNGDFLIHAAVKANNINIVKLLIQNGADVNVINSKNETPLTNAITTSNVDIIKELLLNCNIDTFINGINKALSDSRPDILRILMEDNLFNKAFEYPDERILKIVPFIVNKFLDNFSNIYMELAKVIISKIGIDIFKDSFTEKFILVDNYAIYASDNTIIEFLIELGAKVDIVSSMSGDTPLFTSARNHYTSLEVVKSLVNNVEDKSLFINKQNKNGDKALDLFLNSESSIIKFLIENGGDVNYKNNLGETFLMHACKSSFNISYVINKVTDINTQSNIGETALMWAIKAENNIAVKLLLDNKPNILLQTKDEENVLDIAIKMNNVSLLNLLHEYIIISNNVDINPEYKKIIESYISRSRLRWKDACKSNNVAVINKYKKLFNIKETDINGICSKLDEKEQEFEDYKMKVINKCINSEDLLGDDLKDMYPENFYSYEQNGITYCEDIRTMFKLVSSSGIVKNPYTREVLSVSIIQDIKDKYKIYNMISNDESKESKESNESNESDSDEYDARNLLLIQNLESDEPNLETITELLENGADANIENRENRYLIFSAIDSDNVDIVRQFLRHRADVNVQSNDRIRKTLLEYAIDKGNLDIIKVLLPYCNTDTFKDAFHGMIDYAELDMLKVLIQDDIFYRTAADDIEWRDDILEHVILDIELDRINFNRMIEIIKLIVSSQTGRQMVLDVFREIGPMTISSSNSLYVENIQFLRDLGAEFNDEIALPTYNPYSDSDSNSSSDSGSESDNDE